MDPQQLNSYSYGRNNPITLSDPNGNIAFVPLLIGILAVYHASMSAIDAYNAVQADVVPNTRNEFSRDQKIDANMQVGYDIAQSKATNMAVKAGMKEFSPLIGMIQAMSDAWTKGPDTVRHYRSGAFMNDLKDYRNLAINKIQQAQSLGVIFSGGSTSQARADAVTVYNTASGATANENKLWALPNGAVVTWNGTVVSPTTNK
jgi:hypothetical protein